MSRRAAPKNEKNKKAPRKTMDKKMNWKESKTKKMHNVNKQHEKGEGQMRIEGVDRKKGCKKKKEAGKAK